MAARERLLGRSIPPVTVTIRADFSPESDVAFGEVEAASRALHDAQARGADLASHEVRLHLANEATATYVEAMQIVVLPPHEYDALIDSHPPTDEQREQGASWNAGFIPALLAACLHQDGEPVMPAEDWAAWAKTPGAASSGEQVMLFNLCVSINDRTPDLHVGKGFGGTLS